ncbi:FAD-dependent oxidoreductase [uncultured Agrobacterium sp.]|uniref:NAD(P)/FAD-dependent oxidoreductase n=1 Tax=uncultured Agrobacterium sp. TaxID=157277 RepID=UPI0025F9932C|nr:FAD-dependent oxidoreductase [uncultured Agrobacterium sp.]
MVQADSLPDHRGQSSLPPSASLLIIGGGIMGLWAARKADRLGIDTVLVDAGHAGCGASGGLLGALMPHMPDRWNDKKQFQFDALLTLEDEIARLEAETGLSAGYRRCGRIIPLPKPHLRVIAERHSQEAKTNWDQQGQRFHWHVLDAPPADNWVDASAGQAGFVHDTFAAKVSPRGLVASLTAFLNASRHVRVVERQKIVSLGKDSIAHFDDGSRLSFSHAIVSAGYASFPLLTQTFALRSEAALGQAVKGQAALLRGSIDSTMPVVFLNGIYIVPHEDGTVAIGSTSEDSFAEPFVTDDKLDALLRAAREIVPELSKAKIIERWAGLRPKAIGRDPMVGAHPEHSHIVALTGGFKVSFGLAHRLADAALCAVQGKDMDVPSSFRTDAHLALVHANL